MKKNGFTLAEVLVTLGIIGVVSALTLPALTGNTKEQQYIAALKKGVNTLSNAAEMNYANNGFNYNKAISFGNVIDSAYDDVENTPKRTIAAILKLNANVDLQKSTADMIVFRDGTSIMPSDNSFVGECSTNLESKITRVTPIIFDANGPKGPNKMSSFNRAGDVRDKNNRKVSDRFSLCLGGNFASAASPLETWALYGDPTRN